MTMGRLKFNALSLPWQSFANECALPHSLMPFTDLFKQHIYWIGVEHVWKPCVEVVDYFRYLSKLFRVSASAVNYLLTIMPRMHLLLTSEPHSKVKYSTLQYNSIQYITYFFEVNTLIVKVSQDRKVRLPFSSNK